MKPAIALTDKERFPLIDDLSFLNQLKQDEYAPKFNFQSGDRLNEEHLKKFASTKSKSASIKNFGIRMRCPSG